MSEMRIEFNSAGFREILLSDGVKTLVEETANGIRDRANSNNSRGGEGFEAQTMVGGYGGGRWIAFVHTTDRDSMIAEAEDKALSRAVK